MQLVICFLFFTGGLAVYLQSEMNMKNIFPFLYKQEREHILEVNLTYPQLQGLETLISPVSERLPVSPMSCRWIRICSADTFDDDGSAGGRAVPGIL